MGSWVRKRLPLRRKLQTQRSFTRRKSLRTAKVRKSSTVIDAMLHIYLLKRKLEALHKECLDLMAIKTKYLDLIKHIHMPKEVKVEKIEEGFRVRVTCEKADDTLVSILEAFDEMGLNILQAKVSCNSYFAMEAIAAHEAQNQEYKLDVTGVTQAIIKAIKKRD
uniref:uncharacterized protein LOC105350388 isoform X2 n=1 Tax=Fragaria vesca subsp. vesca TaxID=101020 RepID=UPI0005C9BA69|nr:PREDICTED: uncharacterized protein LOC105350388 isoform X2 [Fragaria vesca subsp. vesca]